MPMLSSPYPGKLPVDELRMVSCWDRKLLERSLPGTAAGGGEALVLEIEGLVLQVSLRGRHPPPISTTPHPAYYSPRLSPVYSPRIIARVAGTDARAAQGGALRLGLQP